MRNFEKVVTIDGSINSILDGLESYGWSHKKNCYVAKVFVIVGIKVTSH